MNIDILEETVVEYLTSTREDADNTMKNKTASSSSTLAYQQGKIDAYKEILYKIRVLKEK